MVGNTRGGPSGLLAEREGFEPSVGVAYTRLAGEHLQPLGHLSWADEADGFLADLCLFGKRFGATAEEEGFDLR